MVGANFPPGSAVPPASEARDDPLRPVALLGPATKEAGSRLGDAASAARLVLLRVIATAGPPPPPPFSYLPKGGLSLLPGTFPASAAPRPAGPG